jgi:hypothetical protein
MEALSRIDPVNSNSQEGIFTHPSQNKSRQETCKPAGHKQLLYEHGAGVISRIETLLMKLLY